MKPEAISALLEHVLILRELPADALSALAETLPVERFEAGDIIYKQGAAPDALYILLEGQVELRVSEKGEAERTSGLRYPGDLIGEVEMVYRQPRLNTVHVSDDARVLRWERASLTEFMKSHSEALADMQFLAQGQRLAHKLNFKWLREGENIYILARKNNFILYQKLVIPILLLMGGAFFVLWTLLADVGWSTWFALIPGFAGLLTGAWQWVDWSNDYYLV
jgi:signal-transduction protein with cAMP-binding, CBS, and nucleotidyltransferase domain